MRNRSIAVAAAGLLAACGAQAGGESALDSIAREYLVLELSMDLHDDKHVDAYFGPDSLRKEAAAAALSLREIGDRAGELTGRLRDLPDDAGGNTARIERIKGLLRRIEALKTRIAIVQGQTFPFDEESRRLFGVTAPDYDAAHFASILARIDKLLPGDGSLPSRVEAFRKQFVVPRDKLDAVFDAAIAECRRRTLAHIDLPENESFRLEYVSDKPWSGYNWYQGNAHSLIQINTDLPIYISRAIELGCHEGYPGHHVFNTLLEQNLVNGKGWLEFTLYPLFSPQSLIAEGSANYGIELTFPDDERVAFEKRVLFPLAGLDPAKAERYYDLLELLDRLGYADNEAARDYLNGTIDREQAVQWLIDYALLSPERAHQRVDFIETYRSYVINYNLGKDLVKHYVERGADTQAKRWQRFEKMLSSPMLPSDLQAQ